MKNGSFCNIRVKRVLLYGSVAVGAVLLLLIVLVASLPVLVSSPSVQAYIRQSLTKSLKRPVAWSGLTMSWSRGLTLKGLKLGDGPPPLLRAGVDEVRVEPAVSLGEKRRLKVDLTLRVSTVSAELAPGPPKPPKPYEEPLTALAKAVQQFEGLDWPLPLDLSVRVDVLPVRLAYRDPATGRRLTVSDLALRFDMPSLADRPIVTDLRGELAVDGHRPEPVRLKANVKGLVSKERHLRPASAQFALDAAMPGGSLTVTGGLREPDGFVARGRLDLPRLLAAARPLLKPSTPAVAGEVTIVLAARMNDSHDLNAALDIAGSKLTMSGGTVKKGRLGPLDLRMRQNIASDHGRRQVRFADGSLAVPGLMEAAWHATVERPDRPDRSLEAEFGPLRVNLKRALSLAGPFLPPTLPVRELEGELTVRKVSARLNGRKNRGDASLEGAGVILPRLRLALAKGAVTAEGVTLAIDRLACPLTAMKPTKIDADLSYGLQRATVAGATPLTAEGLRGTLRLALRDLVLKNASPRKFTAIAELTQALDLGRLHQEKRLTIADLHEQLRLTARAGATGEIEATLPELKVAAASFLAIAPGRKLPPLPLSAALTAEGIRVPATPGASPSLGRATCEVA
ncbi:MAG TPA: hypothetical protein VIU40_12915, partial [Geobacteraceae bacterium]